ncbi:hypothetical protein [Planktothrix sp. FACHB-1365]|uniref:hypothetical protein n=1 Tax=Planktothrix sp. FACHB-1365 TaxID=2692855 RepID=UPI00168457AC|nr:hypothetical protein [Planktothrix sp. FACHB-1365]MBD2481543.1 hypothetical protein [Planktothrix sp. FACHB-1365]
MNITPQQYPQFNDTTLESLLLSLARKILEIQKDSTLNSTSETIITITEDLNNETTEVQLKELQASIVNGIITIKNYFNYDFTDGVGQYPFNRTNIVDAFFHVLMFQQKHELNIAKNPGSLMCCDFDIANVSEMNMTQQLVINAGLTDYPITVTNGNSLTTASKQYLI